MSTMYVLSNRGDTEMRWDPSDPSSVAKARSAFDEYRRARYLAFVTTAGDGQAIHVGDFDPKADEIVLTRPLSGG
jgi:hypothetical protein